jgi:geranylgeranyl diphosphate synthase type II
MDAITRIEQTLVRAVATAEAPGAPPGLAAAMRHAVFPRGARIRPRLCLAVAAACDNDEPGIAAGAAAHAARPPLRASGLWRAAGRAGG